MRGVGSGRGFLLNERKVSWSFAGRNDLGEQKSADSGDQGKKCRRDAWGQRIGEGAQDAGGDIFFR